MIDNTSNTITEDDLHGFADGQLTTERAEQVEIHLSENPQDAQMVAEWIAQNDALQLLFQEASAKDDHLRITANTPQAKSGMRIPLQAIAAVAIFATGLLSNSLVSRYFSATTTTQYAQDLPEAARAGYTIYASEVRHPVEVGADEETHLVTWLSNRLDANFTAPDLTKVGFRLIGGRLVPYAGKPGALLMYEDTTGERLTVLIGRQPGATETGFKFSQTGNVRTFYWMDGDLGYALSGAVDRQSLEALAYEVYHQI